MRSAIPLIVLTFAGCVHYSASELAIRRRARGFKDKTFAQVARITAADGIDASEALAIAEIKILGAVDFGSKRVMAYTQPISHGDEWRIGVNVVTNRGIVDRPIYVDKITGYSHGDGWYNESIGDTPIGNSSFQLERRKTNLNLSVRFGRMTRPGDQSAKAECMKDAQAALDLILRGFRGRLEARKSEIKLTEDQVSDTDPQMNRSWRADVLLREK